MKPPEKQPTLGTALLYSNIGLPIAGAYFYFSKTFSARIAIEAIVITFVVLNVYYLIAFKVWGSKSK
jgi:hypothetical protein